jgi:hypothetical protein
MQVSNRYDNDLQMFVEGVREPDVRHLRFLRWLAERGELEQEIAGPSSGALIAPLTHPTSERTTAECMPGPACPPRAPGPLSRHLRE